MLHECVVRRNNRAIANAFERKWFNKSVHIFSIRRCVFTEFIFIWWASASHHAWAWAWIWERERSVKAIKTFFYVRWFYFSAHWNDEMMMMMIIAWLHYVVWSGQTQTEILRFIWNALHSVCKCDFFSNNRLFCSRVDAGYSGDKIAHSGGGDAGDDINSQCEQVVLSQMWFIMRFLFARIDDAKCAAFRCFSSSRESWHKDGAVVTRSRCQTMSTTAKRTHVISLRASFPFCSSRMTMVVTEQRTARVYVYTESPSLSLSLCIVLSLSLLTKIVNRNRVDSNGWKTRSMEKILLTAEEARKTR